MERRTYRNPPIEEALCEFRFSGSEWDVVATPAALYAELRGEYLGAPQYQNVVTANVLSGPQIPASVSVLPGSSRLRLVSADEKRIVMVAPDLLSVHVLRPYPGWDEDFRDRIRRALVTFQRCAKPKCIARIGVRYINRIALRNRPEPIAIEEYFNGVPSAIEGLPERLGAFVHRTERGYDDGVKMVHTLASMGSTEDSTDFLLDLDVVWEREYSPEIADVMTVVADLRARERKAFEATITDKLREVFDA